MISAVCLPQPSHDRSSEFAGKLMWVVVAMATLLLSRPALAQLTPVSFKSTAPGERLVLVDVGANTLSVVENGQTQLLFENIALGRGGAAPLRLQGDGKTPMGEFRVAWINRNSRFNLFFGLDFPNLDYAQRAYRSRLIDEQTYSAIETAFRNHRPPPQNTQLGGYIGIHGIGRGNPRVHELLNWTDGCVAVTNQQIRQLARWVDVGTRVIIR
jgi:murein L,D-transpeptidase YafK